jgi:hypothetical protein
MRFRNIYKRGKLSNILRHNDMLPDTALCGQPPPGEYLTAWRFAQFMTLMTKRKAQGRGQGSRWAACFRKRWGWRRRDQLPSRYVSCAPSTSFTTPLNVPLTIGGCARYSYRWTHER